MEQVRILRVEKKKGSLGFSVKGGKEHGIPIVVSEIDKKGPTSLHLGDELVSVNEANLQGVTHLEAVQKLRNSKGPVVILKVKPNRILEDTFLSPEKKDAIATLSSVSHDKTGISDWWVVPDENPTPLPQGWSRKVDHKSGKPYFENHLTCTATWTDPRSLAPVPLDDFNWRDLPVGWERFKDQHGDVYYVNHDTQTTHWDSPRGMREQKQMEEIRAYLDKKKERLKTLQDEITEKRTVLIRKNQELEALQESEDSQTMDNETKEREDEEEVGVVGVGEEGGGADEEDRKEELIDDIMSLNDEVEEMDSQVAGLRKVVQKLNEILWKAQSEEIGDIDPHESANTLAKQLKEQLQSLRAMEEETHVSIQTLESIRGPEDTPISYMLQMTPAKDKGKAKENDKEDETGKWVHLLSDRLTGKTNCEMRVELHLLEVAISHASQLTKRASEVCQWVRETRGFDWDHVTDELLGMDLSVFNDEWIKSNKLSDKLLMLTS